MIKYVKNRHLYYSPLIAVKESVAINSKIQAVVSKSYRALVKLLSPLQLRAQRTEVLARTRISAITKGYNAIIRL